jgi:hypothetical protein
MVNEHQRSTILTAILVHAQICLYIYKSSGGSIINWPKKSGSGILKYGSGSLIIIKDLTKLQKKFKILYYLMIYLLFDNTFFSEAHYNVQIGSGSGRICNSLASRIRIRKSGLRIRGSRSERNIYGSTKQC